MMWSRFFRLSAWMIGVSLTSLGIAKAQDILPTDVVAEADVLWPRAGETFALNDKGMGMVIAIQNYAEAQKYGLNVDWLMCMDRPEQPGFRECDFAARYSDDSPLVVLRNDSSSPGWSDNSKWKRRVYRNEPLLLWTFSIGPWCEYTNRNTTYGISHKISGGTFNVTMDPSAPYPTPTPATCASFLGAVSYAGVTTYDFQRSVDNPPGCVQTQSVTADPAPCRRPSMQTSWMPLLV
ncbi:hypothetical protein AB5N19_06175 [Seiridium cardinale]|uniref:DUF7136 domain-containing protein n=1 Tax=Seiridium cardinale TaxID=138064 RepID=A0ABR2Y6J1_9PEZI